MPKKITSIRSHCPKI